jgi:hypothetical protein
MSNLRLYCLCNRSVFPFVCNYCFLFSVLFVCLFRCTVFLAFDNIYLCQEKYKNLHFFFFEIGFCCVDQADLELQSICLKIQSAGNTGKHHSTWLSSKLFRLPSSYFTLGSHPYFHGVF